LLATLEGAIMSRYRVKDQRCSKGNMMADVDEVEVQFTVYASRAQDIPSAARDRAEELGLGGALLNIGTAYHDDENQQWHAYVNGRVDSEVGSDTEAP
jgi:hypothetical protein